MNTRSDDVHPAQPFVKVSREIPLPWLIGGAIAFVVSTTQNWQAQQANDKNIEKMTAQLSKLEQSISTDNTTRLLKDQDRDSKVLILTNQLQNLENRINGLPQKR